MYHNSRCLNDPNLHVQEKASGRVEGVELHWNGRTWTLRQRCTGDCVDQQESGVLASARDLLGKKPEADQEAILPVQPRWLVRVNLEQSTWSRPEGNRR
jgi:hypothetical protein